MCKRHIIFDFCEVYEFYNQDIRKIFVFLLILQITKYYYTLVNYIFIESYQIQYKKIYLKRIE